MPARYPLAVAFLAAAVALAQLPADPRAARQAFQDGATLQKDGKHAEAVAKFEAALLADPRPGFRYALAVNLLELGKKDDAVKHFKQFLTDTADPAAADARYAVAQLEDLLVPKLTAAQRRKLDAIDDAFEAAKELGDDGTKKVFTAFNGAVDDLYALQREAPGHLPLLLKMARAYEIQKSFDRAAAAYAKYLDGYKTHGFDPIEVREARKRFVVCKQMVGDEKNPGDERKFEIADGVKMTFCWIPPGEAQLGSPKTERDAVWK